MRAHPIPLAAAFSLYFASLAGAHDTWLLPDRFRAEAGDTVTLALTSGMEFPKNDHAVDPGRIESARLWLAGTEQAIVRTRSEQDHLALSAPLAAAGIAGFAISSKPRDITLEPHQVDEYLAEIGASAAVVAAWRNSGAGAVHERYRKHATTFVRVGSPDEASVPAAWGLDLELVPAVDPTSVAAGAVLPFRLVFRSAPLAGATVTLAGVGGGAVTTVRTDESGQAAVTVPVAGLWLLKAVHVRPTSAPGEPWEGDFATLTFEAGGASQEDAMATVGRFGRALRSADRVAVLDCLAPDVVIYEHGGAELSRDEYASHHLDGDLAYLAEIDVRVVDRKVLGGTDRAIVLTRTESSGHYKGKPVASRGTETLVLERRGERWLIVHVHWSSARSSGGGT